MTVLGISGRDRDAAAALAMDGRIVAAATEDSFARVAGIGSALTRRFPHAAVNACLRAANIEAGDVDEMVIVDDGEGADGQRGNDNGATRTDERAAERTISAVDALVMGRFLLMKDYWLLRTQDK